jgi:hypothetical protein
MNTPTYPYKEGQWIFTCTLKPLQFSHVNIWSEEMRKEFPNLSDEEWNEIKNDDFITLGGSHHSKKNCSCKPISEAYAQWFIKNNVHLLYEKYRDHNRPFDSYEVAVRTLCIKEGIEFEGI